MLSHFFPKIFILDHHTPYTGRGRYVIREGGNKPKRGRGGVGVYITKIGLFLILS